MTSLSDLYNMTKGKYFNPLFGAHNIWEIDVNTDLIDEAADIFYNGAPFAELQQPGEPYVGLKTRIGEFFAQRVSWKSDIAWISTDDASSFARMQSIFDGLRLSERFASIVPHTRQLRLYNAFFVSRSWCDAHNFHTDYFEDVGTDALTLITPLRDFKERDSFQLTYMRENRTAAQDSFEPQIDRYMYKKGRAIVFGSQFLHSTEPGRGHKGEVHAYLCFTFGTDRQGAWPRIAKTLDTQSRVVMHPDGQLALSKIGREIERMVQGG